MGAIYAGAQVSDLFFYADTEGMERQQIRAGSRRKVLHRDPET
jgi:hypothetical protein